LAGSHTEPEARPELTDDQAKAWEGLRPRLGQGNWTAGQPHASHPTMPEVCLVHGVTGSGKTELYLRAIEHVLFQGRQAIVLVPEIALTPQTVRRFSSRFPGRVGVWHSELSEGERLDTWHRARQGLLDVIVGSRSAIFAPLTRLGLIVVDESHADAYKQARTPRYHARDVSLRRAALEGAVVLLGSATPSVESYRAAEEGRYTLLELPRRVVTGMNAGQTVLPKAMVSVGSPGPSAQGGDPSSPPSAAASPGSRGPVVDWGELPPVEIVDMRAELKAGNTSMFSRPLAQALGETLAHAGQAILFLNRRGSATFVLCRDCGHVSSCPRCEAPLTWHGHGQALVCHHCNHRQSPPMMCPDCGSPRIRYFGAGTQKVEETAQAAFPGARILRWDADTTGRKGAHEAILAQFIGGRADILVGTQMVAKGLDLPRVTLVGVISADTGLHFPDFRASERSFQLLSQVAGRAGRSAMGGKVIMQTYAPDNPAIVSAAQHDYAGFYEREMAFRKSSGYPPFGKLIRMIHLADRDRSAQAAAREMADRLNARIERMGLADTRLIGPSPAFFRMARGKARWHLIIRSPNPHALLEDFVAGAGWRIDVDPVDLL
jgi:primosomal protein N' (replication factor Y)